MLANVAGTAVGDSVDIKKWAKNNVSLSANPGSRGPRTNLEREKAVASLE